MCYFFKNLVPFNFYFFYGFCKSHKIAVIYFSIQILFELYRFFLDKLLFDFIYNKFFFHFIINLSFNFLKTFDRGFIETVIPLFFIVSLSNLSKNFYFFQSGFFFDYLLLIFYFIFFLFFYLFI